MRSAPHPWWLGAALWAAFGCSPEVSLGHGVEESESTVPDRTTTGEASTTETSTSTGELTSTTAVGEETSFDPTSSDSESGAPEPLGCFQHPMRSPCEMCLRGACCEDYLRCLDDPFCWCITFCLPSPTSAMCEIDYFDGMCDGGARGAALRECAATLCSSTCGDP